MMRKEVRMNMYQQIATWFINHSSIVIPAVLISIIIMALSQPEEPCRTCMKCPQMKYHPRTPRDCPLFKDGLRPKPA